MLFVCTKFEDAAGDLSMTVHTLQTHNICIELEEMKREFLNVAKVVSNRVHAK